MMLTPIDQSALSDLEEYSHFGRQVVAAQSATTDAPAVTRVCATRAQTPAPKRASGKAASAPARVPTNWRTESALKPNSRSRRAAGVRDSAVSGNARPSTCNTDARSGSSKLAARRGAVKKMTTYKATDMAIDVQKAVDASLGSRLFRWMSALLKPESTNTCKMAVNTVASAIRPNSSGDRNRVRTAKTANVRRRDDQRSKTTHPIDRVALLLRSSPLSMVIFDRPANQTHTAYSGHFFIGSMTEFSREQKPPAPAGFRDQGLRRFRETPQPRRSGHVGEWGRHRLDKQLGQPPTKEGQLPHRQRIAPASADDRCATQVGHTGRVNGRKVATTDDGSLHGKRLREPWGGRTGA